MAIDPISLCVFGIVAYVGKSIWDKDLKRKQKLKEQREANAHGLKLKNIEVTEKNLKDQKEKAEKAEEEAKKAKEELEKKQKELEEIKNALNDPNLSEEERQKLTNRMIVLQNEIEGIKKDYEAKDKKAKEERGKANQIEEELKKLTNAFNSLSLPSSDSLSSYMPIIMFAVGIFIIYQLFLKDDDHRK